MKIYTVTTSECTRLTEVFSSLKKALDYVMKDHSHIHQFAVMRQSGDDPRKTIKHIMKEMGYYEFNDSHSNRITIAENTPNIAIV